MAKPDEEKLREELKVLLQAQAEWAEELQELSLRRDAMMQKAQAAEAAVEAERQAMDDLERECHSFDLRKRQANEEEANSQSLAENISAELQTFGPANISTESRKGGKGGKNGKGKGKAIVVSPPAALQEEIASLRAQVAQERQRAAQEDEAQERATRARVEEQCMLLRALIDMVTGSGELSKADTFNLVQQLSRVPRLSEEHPDAWSLLAQQAERNGVARRELLECCNQELRRRQRSVHELLDEDFLPRLLDTLKGDGIVEGYERPQTGLADRLRDELLKR